VRRADAQKPFEFEPFVHRPRLERAVDGFDGPHHWPLEVQFKWWNYRRQAALLQHDFRYQYEKAYRHSNRFTRRQARWKDPLVELGAQAQRKTEELRKEFDEFKHKWIGYLTVKTADDFAGAPPRGVA
jgi:hypothetical protein